jgi:hypothetical protein
VAVENGVFWDMKTQYKLHRIHITSPLQSPAGQYYVRFEVFTAVAVENGVFWDKNPSSYFTGDTLRLRYRAQPVYAMSDLRFSRR